MNVSPNLTHRVAVAAYIFRDNKMLLLRRSRLPFTLTPPGGRLEIGEDPLEGLRREVREETGLSFQFLGVAQTWFGRISEDQEPLLAVNYLARCDSGDVQLSDEHSEFIWASRDDIISGAVKTTDEEGRGYHRESLLDAWDRFHRLTT